MRQLLKSMRARFLQRPDTAPPAFNGSETPTPDRPACIIGDIHGCSDLLDRLLDTIEADRVQRGWTQTDLVFVGDYVDRGPASATVLTRLMTLQGEAPDRVHCLRGNHEQMMLDFLADPETNGPLWLMNGGRETLISFGVTPPLRLQTPEALEALHKSAMQVIPADVLAWLSTLPFHWQSGDVVAVHAGLDPAGDLTSQTGHDMLWGPPGFPGTPRSDGLWVVHGHRITVPPVIENGRITTDTGAFARGELSCAVLNAGDAPRYLTATTP